MTGLTLITGATGKTGRRVADRLTARGVAVRLASRGSTPALDWNDPATWPGCLDGVGAAYIAYSPDLAAPGALEIMEGFLDAAQAAGVSRIVLLSGRGEPEAQACEQALAARPFHWTVLRCSWFNQNFSESVFAEGVVSGQIVTPPAVAAEPFVDLEDVADAAAAALTDARHAGRIYELTGPEAITFAEAARRLGAAVGRPVKHVAIPAADYAHALSDAGVPEQATGLVLYLFETVLDGRNTPVTDGVEAALGRPAASFDAFARRAAAQGAWG